MKERILRDGSSPLNTAHSEMQEHARLKVIAKDIVEMRRIHSVQQPGENT